MYSESELIASIRRRFQAGSARIGIGDDAAVVDIPDGFSTVFCSDLLAEGTHFRRATHPADSVGFKAIAVNVSDVAAMGARAVYCVMSIGIPSDLESAWIDGFLNGVACACERFGVELVGGDSSRASSIFVDVAMIGRVRTGQDVRRSGARAGDGVYVTGPLGGAALGLRMLEQGKKDHPSVRRQLYPEPRPRLGEQLASHVTSMIDVSDGLSVDLGHILDESEVSARIDPARIPREPAVPVELALHGGEDYELLFTSAGRRTGFEDESITRIGEIIEAGERSEIYCMTPSGDKVLPRTGWQHFR